MNAEDKEKCIEKIRMQAATLREDLKKSEKGGIRMWQEIKNYPYGRK